MPIETVATTATGPERGHNEDSVYVDTTDDVALLAVADGMGGHRAGDLASEEALETFVNYLTGRDWNETEDAATVEEDLIDAAREANSHLHELAADNPALEGMGTTLVAALLIDKTATLINVGDSRGYHVTGDGIEQVTTDQSLVQQLVEEGAIEPEEADDHPQKNVLSQALGTAETIEPETYRLHVEGTVLLCSDGLSDEVADEKIHELVTTADSLEVAAELLVDRANEVDGSDNVSVALGHRSDFQ
jgi:serine/threonine protein phosphatase PrpC